MSEVVVLGAGLGGSLAAYELRAQLRTEDRLTVIGQGAHYHFVPSNPWVAVGWRKRKDIEIDIASVMADKSIRYYSQGAKRLKPEENCLILEDDTVVPYDYLLIATGPDLAFDEIEGLGPSGHTQSVCHIEHAAKSYEAFEKFVENPGPVIIGAVQGASCFGPAYEFAFILDTELRRRKIRDQVPMTFVTSEPYIGHLGLDGVGDTKGMLESEFRNRHIKWVTSARVKKVEVGQMAIEEIGDDGSVKKETVLPFHYAMMLPAFRGVPAIRDIPGLVNPRGFVLIDQFQRSKAFANIFAVGVCVAIPPIAVTPVPVGVPKTGFMIESMVTAASRNIGQLLLNKRRQLMEQWAKYCHPTKDSGRPIKVKLPRNQRKNTPKQQVK